MSCSGPIVASLKIPFPTRREAEIAYDVLRVDAEPRRSFVEKTLRIEDNQLLVEFRGDQAKTVRVGVGSFLESLILCCETIDQFGPASSVTYDHY